MASLPNPVFVTADDFLRMDFGPNRKAELVDGVIRMMGGGTRAHSRVQSNIVRHLGNALAGKRCSAHGSEMAIKVSEGEVYYPDVSVYYGDHDAPEHDLELAGTDPTVVVEILSPSTKQVDQQAKLPRYQSVRSIETIVFIDPVAQLIRTLTRSGEIGWVDTGLTKADSLELASLSVSIPAIDIFARS